MFFWYSEKFAVLVLCAFDAVDWLPSWWCVFSTQWNDCLLGDVLFPQSGLIALLVMCPFKHRGLIALLVMCSFHTVDWLPSWGCVLSTQWNDCSHGAVYFDTVYWLPSWWCALLTQWIDRPLDDVFFPYIGLITLLGLCSFNAVDWLPSRCCVLLIQWADYPLGDVLFQHSGLFTLLVMCSLHTVDWSPSWGCVFFNPVDWLPHGAVYFWYSVLIPPPGCVLLVQWIQWPSGAVVTMYFWCSSLIALLTHCTFNTVDWLPSF